MQPLCTSEVEARDRIIVLDDEVTLTRQGVLAKLVGNVKADIVDARSRRHNVRRLLVDGINARAVIQFPMPRERTVAAFVSETDAFAKHDGCLREVEAGCRCRSTNHNLFCHTA